MRNGSRLCENYFHFSKVGELPSKLDLIEMPIPIRGVMNNAPQARIIYDKFHIMRHLSKWGIFLFRRRIFEFSHSLGR